MPDRSLPSIVEHETETPATAIGVSLPRLAPTSQVGAAADWSANYRETKTMFEAFVDAVTRLERILDLETERLGRHDVAFLSESNQEKSLGLLELTRTLQPLRGRDCLAQGFDVGPVLVRLRGKIESNLACLAIHMKAVTEIAAIIVKAIVDHESDGTYSTTMIHVGNRR